MYATNEQRIKSGKQFIGFLWERIATKIDDLAIEVYGLDDNQKEALKTAFITRVQYTADMYL
jgi:hypothetical protein